MARIKLFFQQATEVVGEEKEGLLILTDSFPGAADRHTV